MAIRVGIFGYGNLGRGVEQAIRHNPDMELVGVFSRRDPATVKIKTPGVPVYSEDALVKQEVPMDVLILCGGSATDLSSTALTHTLIFRSTSRMLTRQRRKPARSESFPAAGIPECSP